MILMSDDESDRRMGFALWSAEFVGLFCVIWSIIYFFEGRLIARGK